MGDFLIFFFDLLRVYELYENSKYMKRRESIKHDPEDRGGKIYYSLICFLDIVECVSNEDH